MRKPKEPTSQSERVKEHLLTYDDYATRPDDGIHYELANGVLEAMSPTPTPTHQLIVALMLGVFHQTCQKEYVFIPAPVDVILSNVEVRQPDIVAVHRERLDIITSRGIEGIPDLVVEILSAASVKRDRKDKLVSYAAHGIPEYWILSPELRTLEQYCLNGRSYKLAGIYSEADVISSNRIQCVRFSLADVFKAMPNLPNATM